MFSRTRPTLLRIGSALPACILLALPAVAHALSPEDIIRQPVGLLPLVAGIVLIVIALFIEWQDILNVINLESTSLASIEKTHPRLPKAREIIIVVILSATMGIFFAEILLYFHVSSYIPSSPALMEYAIPSS